MVLLHSGIRISARFKFYSMLIQFDSELWWTHTQRRSRRVHLEFQAGLLRHTLDVGNLLRERCSLRPDLR